MAEYIDIDTPLELYVERGGFYRQQITTLRELLDVNHLRYEIADVRPVVRGRDCKHWDIDWVPNYAKENEHFCPIVTLTTRDDWFCADGEKKEES